MFNFFFFTIALIFTDRVQARCPDIKASADVNLTEYLRATWYIQQQQVNGYQNASDLFCTLATYVSGEKTVPFFSGTVAGVHNYENVGSVNGPAEGVDMVLCARENDKSRPGALLVAPCFLPNFAAGPYWILDVGSDSKGEYTWSIVSGGAPTVQFDDGCTTKEAGVNGSGLWIFTRVPTGAGLWVEQARNRLQQLGYTLQRLKEVKQAGCKYKGALIKNGATPINERITV